MSNQPETDELVEEELNEVLATIEEIVKAALGDNYIFRGENQMFDHVSSGLFRQYHPNRTDSSTIELFQAKILEEAQRFTSEKDENEILSQLQHFESGLTNLIDFTTDYLIALFFACDGAPGSDARVVLLRRENANTFRATGPSNRAIAQKSIFVRPATGIVEPDAQVHIPANLKQRLLQYLRTYHGITPETIYNDLHGFIRHWSINEQASKAFMSGLEYRHNGNYLSAIDLYTESLFLLPRPPVYFERGCAYLEVIELDKAIADFDKVQWPALAEGNPILSGAACNGRGVARRSLGMTTEAVDDFKSALTFYSMTLEPSDYVDTLSEEATSNLIVALMEVEDYQSALSYAREALEGGHDPRSCFREEYGDIESFELCRDSQVPEALAQMLSGQN